jgi:hypothetical protein
MSAYSSVLGRTTRLQLAALSSQNMHRPLLQNFDGDVDLYMPGSISTEPAIMHADHGSD